MKPRRPSIIRLVTIGSLALSPIALFGASGTWSATSGSPASWATASNWGGTANVGNTEGDSATIQTNITAAYTVNLNGVRTVGNLTIGDSDSSNTLTLAAGTTSILTFDQTGTGTAMLVFTSGATVNGTTTASDTISAPIQLNDNLRAYSTSSTAGSNKTISGVISGIGKSITFDNDNGITLAGPVATAGSFTLSGTNQYTGGTTIDDVRVALSNGSGFGGSIGGTVEVKDGGGVWINTTTAVDTSFNLTGTGWLEGNGKLGTIRMGSGSSSTAYTINGNISISGTPGNSLGATPDASISPTTTSTTAANGVINGVVSGGDLMVGADLSAGGTGGATTWTGSDTLTLTAANTYGDTIIRALNLPTSGQTTLLIGGSANTTATLGTGKVYLSGGTGGRIASIRFQRADGYILQQNIETLSAAGTKTALITDVAGTGFTLNGKTVTVLEQVRVGGNATGTSFNIDSGTINAGQFFVGNAANLSGTVNQTGGTVNLTGEVRVAHWPTETSVWNMSGGTLNLTGTPASNPYGTGGTEATVGMGTLYVGIDGQGVFNHSGGTVTAAAVVLDNRTNSGSGTNMTTGVDLYNLTGGTLNLGSATSAWGVQGNASSEFAFGGGTLKAGTSLPISVAMSASGTGSVLDTNSHTVTLKAGITGSGDLTLSDSTATTGKIVFDLATNATVSASLGGAIPIEKTGTGLLTLGGTNTNTGTTTVTAGGLRITGSATGNTTVDGATLWTGGDLTGNLTLAPTSNCVIRYGDAPLAITGNLLVGGGSLNDVNPVGTTVPAPGTYPLITFTGTFSGSTANFQIDPAATTSYRQTFGITAGANSINLTVSGTNLALDWTGNGTTGGDWDIATTTNWAGSEKFYLNDSVTFGDSALSANPGTATLTTAIANSNNDLVFTAKTPGFAGEAVSVSYFAPASPDQPLSVSVIGSAITVNLATDALGAVASTSLQVRAAIMASPAADALVAVAYSASDDGSGLVAAMAQTFLQLPRAALTTAIVNSDNDLTFTAKTAGVAGELVSIRYFAPTDPDQPLSVSVNGNAITVNLKTDAFGFVDSTSAEVKAAIEANPSADALVTVTFATGDETGFGLVAAVPETFLDLVKTENIVIPTGVTVSPSGMVFANNALDYEIDGPGAISGSGGILKSGKGKVGIYSTNSFTGDTVISKGELIAGATNALGTGAIKFGDANTTASDVCTLTLATGPLTIANPAITVESTCLNARIFSTGGTITSPAITKKGTGKLTIGNPTSYSAATAYLTGSPTILVEKGTLAFSSNNALASGTDITLGSTASGSDDTIFEIPNASAGDQSVVNGDFVLGTLGVGDTSRAIFRYVGAGTSGGAPRLDGTLNLNGRDVIVENTSMTSGGTTRLYNFSPNISGTGNVRIRCGTNPDGSFNGGPRARLMYNGNSWNGNLYVETGMVQLYNGAGGSINCVPNNSDIIMSAGTKIGMGCSDTINALSGGEAAGALNPAEIAANLSSSTTTVTLTVGSNNGSGVFGGRLLSGGGYLAFAKTGTGTQTINGNCTHVGTTTVSAGKLIMNGTNASSPVSVSAGATLGGTMTSTATVTSSGAAAIGITATAAGAKIAPGNSTGTMTAVSVNLSTGGILEMELDDTSTPKNDLLAATGTAANALNVTDATLNLVVTGTLSENVYVLATCPTGALTGTFATVTGKPSNYDLVYNYDDGISTNNIALVKLADPYLGWLAAYPSLTGANRAPGVDFDGDGLDNGIEFVIGSDPTAPTGPGTAGYPSASVSGANLVFTFKRSTASKVYPVNVETSTDLASWPPAGAYLIPTADTAGPPVTVAGENVTVTIPMAGAPKKFARVKADIPFTP